jgi:hypothetical protein
MMATATPDPQRTAEALVRLHQTVLAAVRQNLIAEGEDLAAAIKRLSETYAFIKAPVGVDASALVEIMTILLDPALYETVEPQALAAAIAPARARSHRYGPAQHDLPSRESLT